MAHDHTGETCACMDVFHSPEFIEGTRQGIEDWRAGRIQPLSEVLTEMTQTIVAEETGRPQSRGRERQGEDV